MIPLFASLVILGGLQQPQSSPPRLTRIVVQPDTVWFTGELSPATKSDALAYGLVRRTGQWVRVARRSFPSPPRLVPENIKDTVPLVPGFVLALEQRRDSNDSVTSQLGVVAMADHRFYPLIPVLDKAEAEHLRPREGLWYGTTMDARTADLPLAGPSGAWAADNNSVWFGLAGGFSEGYGGVGGLLRFDIRRRVLESVWHDHLLQAFVTALSIAGGGLWIGTLQVGEYGATGLAGLLRYDLRTRALLRYHTESGPLPGNLIWQLASDGQRLWISTDDGLAELHLRTGKWRVAYFEPSLHGDSIVHQLVPKRPSPVTEKLYALMLRLDVRRRAEFLEAVRRLPEDRLACDIEMADCQTAALAAEPLIPFLAEALNGGGGDIAAQALERLRNPNVVPVLRQSLKTAQPSRAPTIALVLARMGDTAGPAWIRRRLQQQPLGQYGSLVIGAAAELRDSANIPALLQLLHSRDHGQSAIFAIGQFEDPRLWQRAAEAVIGDPTAMQHFLLGTRASRAPFKDPGFRRAFDRVIVEALRSPSRNVQTLAAQNLIEQRDTLGLPHLIRLMTEDQYWMPIGEKLRLLVQATGIDSLPVSPTLNWDSDTSEIRRAQAVWRSWWEKSGGQFRFPTEEQGQAALERWFRRWSYEDGEH